MKTEKLIYSQPFSDKQFSSEQNRIPALYTLRDGSVTVSADMRYNHGQDSPNNIDIAFAVSPDGCTDWEYTMVNHFDDYADTVTDKESASFIDSALAESSTGRIFLLCDADPCFCGYLQSKAGTGFCEWKGKKHLLLTKGKGSDRLDSFGFFVGDYEGEKAPVLTRKAAEPTGYYVDKELRLYKGDEPLYSLQKGGKNIKIHQNVFYADSLFKCYKTTYLYLRYSDDKGKTWSSPDILSSQIKSEKEGFLGVGPGRGISFMHQGRERILFCVYDNNGLFRDPLFERASVIYSDDNGATWKRSKKIRIKRGIRKTSEAQVVKIHTESYNALRIYARNLSNYIAYADSLDGGETWTAFRKDKGLHGTKNCMVSLINTSKLIDGKQVLLCSQAGSLNARADGILRAGVIEENGEVSWINKYHINKGFFAYSCLTELKDGSFALFYEDEPSHLSYMIFTLSDTGEISEINGNNLV